MVARNCLTPKESGVPLIGNGGPSSARFALISITLGTQNSQQSLTIALCWLGIRQTLRKTQPAEGPAGP